LYANMFPMSRPLTTIVEVLRFCHPLILCVHKVVHKHTSVRNRIDDFHPTWNKWGEDNLEWKAVTTLPEMPSRANKLAMQGAVRR
jgi:hypothetical protein